MTTIGWIGVTVLLGILVLVLIGIYVLGTRIAQLKSLSKRLNPIPPVNVRLHLHDGTIIPVDTTLSPFHVWRVIPPEGIDKDMINGVSVDEMPPLTSVEVVMGHAEG